MSARRTQLDLFGAGDDLPLFAGALETERRTCKRGMSCTCTARLEAHERGADCVPDLVAGEVMPNLFE